MSEDEHKMLRDQNRGTQAEHLINHPLMKEAFDLYEAEIMKRWRDTGTGESDTFKRERLWQAINLLGKVKEHLFHVVENGKLAKHHLAQLEGRHKA
jgi:hypothetical protein